MARGNGWWARYHEYLRSPEWAAVRSRILHRAMGICEQPGCKKKAVHIHHQTYKNLGNEQPEDLLALCLLCHQAKHPDHKLGSKITGASSKPKKTKRKRTKRARKLAKMERLLTFLKCPHCNKRCRKESDLDRHTAAKHPNVVAEPTVDAIPRPATYGKKKQPKGGGETFDQIVARQKKAREA